MTLKMTSAQVVETSVIVNNNSSFQNYTNPDDHTRQTTDTPGFKPFTENNYNLTSVLPHAGGVSGFSSDFARINTKHRISNTKNSEIKKKISSEFLNEGQIIISF